MRGLVGAVAVLVALATAACSDSTAPGGEGGEGADTTIADTSPGGDNDVPPVETDTGADAAKPDAQQDTTPPPDTNPPEDTGTEEDTDEPVEPSLQVFVVNPPNAPTAGGLTITVEGTGFKPGATVTFGQSVGLNPFVLDDKHMLVDAPPHVAGLVDIIVSNPEVDDVQETAILESAFLYFNPVRVDAVDPTQGHAEGGQAVTIQGGGFRQGSKVLFGTKQALNVQVLSDTTILAVAPVHAPGWTKVHVSNEDGVGTKQNAFFYFQEPRITGVEPAAGDWEGGNDVVIKGVGLNGTPVVLFGDKIAPVKAESATALTVIAPAGTQGEVVDVDVTTDFGADILFGGYAYIDNHHLGTDLTLFNVSPNRGPNTGGTEILITGYGMTSVDDTLVTINGKNAPVLEASALGYFTRVRVPAAKDVEGWVDVALSNSNGAATLPAAFNYERAIVVKDVYPNVGAVEGGSEITIEGEGFEPGVIVKVGALPAINIEVLSDTEIVCNTPPGAPGFAPVSVRFGARVGVLEDAYFYKSEGLSLTIVDPPVGAIAGGTQIRLIGNGFPNDATVFVGTGKATDVQVVDSTLIVAKTPPGPISTVDVEVTSTIGSVVLPDAFTYFNPAAGYGGTWGNPVDGALNVACVNIENDSPIPDAFVILGADPATPHQGFTNLNGQITFSGPDVKGEQFVSASKQFFETASVLKFDAENVTIFMTPKPLPPPGGGGLPPAPPALPLVSGKIFGFDKKTILPPGSCTSNNPAGILCDPCTEDAACGEGNRCSQINPDEPDKFCTTACTTTADCPGGFGCVSLGQTAQCVPIPGQKVIRCCAGTPTIFSTPIDSPNIAGACGPTSTDPDTGAQVQEWVVREEGGAYRVYAYPGETNVVCMGGYDTAGGAFVPLNMGVARHVFTNYDSETYDQDIELNILMDRDVVVRTGEPPKTDGYGSVDTAVLWSYIDFGTDGTYEFDEAFVIADPGETMIAKRLPRSFTGTIHDASFSFNGGVVSLAQVTGNITPYSLALATDVRSTDEDGVFFFEGGAWEQRQSGVKATIRGLWGTASDNIYGVGDKGEIVHFNGAYWTPQPSPTTKTLNAIYGFAADDIYAVGEGGTFIHFNGATWSYLDAPVSCASATKLEASIQDIWAAGPDLMYAVGTNVVWTWDGTQWDCAPKSFTFTNKALTAVDGVDADNVWMTAGAGQVFGYNPDFSKFAPKVVTPAVNLNDIKVLAPDDVWAVGDAGHVFHYDGEAWTEVNTGLGITANLYAIWAYGPNDIHISGDLGTLVHFNGTKWKNHSALDYANALITMWGEAPGHMVATGSHDFLLAPLLEIPNMIKPQLPAGSVLDEWALRFDLAPGYPGSFQYVLIDQPGLNGPIPWWFLVTDHDVTDMELPNFPAIQGTPGLEPGQAYDLTIIRGYKPGFTIDNFDFLDFDQIQWKAYVYLATSFIFQPAE